MDLSFLPKEIKDAIDKDLKDIQKKVSKIVVNEDKMDEKSNFLKKARKILTSIFVK